MSTKESEPEKLYIEKNIEQFQKELMEFITKWINYEKDEAKRQETIKIINTTFLTTATLFNIAVKNLTEN